MIPDPLAQFQAQIDAAKKLPRVVKNASRLRVSQLCRKPWHDLADELEAGGAMLQVPDYPISHSLAAKPQSPQLLKTLINLLAEALEGFYTYKKLAETLNLREQDEAYAHSSSIWDNAQQLKAIIRGCVIVKPSPNL